MSASDTERFVKSGRLVRRLFAVRESGKDMELLLGKLQQTLAPYASDDDDVAAVLALGLEPFEQPRRHGAEAVVTRSTRSAYLVRGDSLYFYHQGSAASANRRRVARATNDNDGDKEELNQYCQELISLVNEFKPRELIAADFSRLVREIDFAGTLARSLRRHLEVVRAGNQTIDLTTPSGKTTWTVLSLVSSMEREALVSRLEMGLVTRAARGDFPFADSRLPFGYRKIGGRAVPDPELLQQVREAIQILGEPGLTRAVRASRIAEAGVTSARLTRQRAKAAGKEVAAVSIRAAADPSAIVDRMYENLDVYRTGGFVGVVKNHIHAAESVMGYRVTGQTEDDPGGLLTIPVELGLPENPELAEATNGDVKAGWATPEELRLALEQAKSRGARDRGRSSHNHVSILNALPAWIDGDFIHWLAGSTDGKMKLNRRRLNESEMADTEGARRRPAGHGRVRRDGEQLAVIRRSDLLESIASRIEFDLTHGVSARELDGVELVRQNGVLRRRTERAHEIAQLSQDLVQHERRAAKLRKVVQDLDDPEIEAGFIRDIKDLEGLKATTAARIEELRVRAASIDLSEGFTTDLDFVLAAVALLYEHHGLVGRETAAAVGEILQDLKLNANANGTVSWSCTVPVPKATGSASLGPFEGTIPDYSRTTGEEALRRASGGATLSAIEASEAFLAEPGDLQSFIRKHDEIGRPYAIRQIREGLRVAGFGPLGVSALPHDSPFMLRQVLREMSIGNTDVAPGFEGWLEVLQRTYFQSNATWFRTWERLHLRRQRFVDELMARGGAMPWSIAKTLVEGRTRTLFEITGETPGPEVIALRSGTEKQADLYGAIRLQSCPHRDCGEFVTRVKSVPELAFGLKDGTMLLCEHCHRPPVAGAPRFPDWYFQ